MISAQITLTNADTNYNIRTLVVAIIGAGTRIRGTEISLQAPSTNVADVLVGDSSLSGTRYGKSLSIGAGYTYRFDKALSLGNLYVRSASAGQKLNVEVQWG